MLQILFAILAGALTVGAPCILPLLPILLGASVGQKSKTRPLFIALGFIVMFSLAGLTLSYLVRSLMVAPDTLRNIAVFALGIFGLLMIWPKPFEILTTKMTGTITAASQTASRAGNGNFGGLVLGLVLGLVWTPCAGPVLGTILTLIASQAKTATASLLLIAYAIGAGLPMVLIAYGGQFITNKVQVLARYSKKIQQIFGALILLLAVAMFYQYDTLLQQKILEHYNFGSLEEKLIQNYNQKGSSQTLPKVEFQNYGPAPEFSGISNWLNSQPLSMQNLRGKVVLIDFWTYSCINCIRTLPYVTKWYDTYKNKGLVIVGVHTPEFEFEKVTKNVETAIKHFKINYPVAQDNAFATWNEYQNEFWPAEYLIDQKGNIVYTHFGEGNYDKTENTIRKLLGLDMDLSAKTSSLGNIRSPEMYFGLSRLRYLSREQVANMGGGLEYKLPEKLKLNEFALSGYWEFFQDKIQSLDKGKIRLHFSSGKVFMVAESPNKPITLKITVDGKAQPDVTVQESQLYTLFDSTDYSEHIIDIEIPENGFEAFTFTFG